MQEKQNEPLVCLNLWDDYADEGPEEPSTFAYVEHDEIEDARAKELLELLETRLQAWAFAHDQDITTRLEMYDSAKVYPSLVGTEHEPLLFKRWQLFVDGLTHVARERFVDHVEKMPLEAKGVRLSLISES